jgi:ABC-2 type transport system ATP-binding protein
MTTSSHTSGEESPAPLAAEAEAKAKAKDDAEASAEAAADADAEEDASGQEASPPETPPRAVSAEGPSFPSESKAFPAFDIEIEDFTHRYGDFVAVRDLNLQIPRGTITGFIGPNGAGKTTTLLLLCTLLRPTAGDARICGFSCSRQRADVRRVMGYMPDRFGVYEGLTAREYLRFFAEAHKIASSKIELVISEAVELLRLGDLMKTPVDGLSRGQLQRLSLARALLADPQVLILDEPASGLDPLARLEFLYILRELRALGKTLFLSSHILSEVSECCDFLAIMSRGKLVAFDRLASIRHRVRPHYSIELVMQGQVEATLNLLRSYPEASRVRANANVVEFDFVGDEDQLIQLHRRMIREELPLLFFQSVQTSLEDAFAMLVEPDPAEAPSLAKESGEKAVAVPGAETEAASSDDDDDDDSEDQEEDDDKEDADDDEANPEDEETLDGGDLDAKLQDSSGASGPGEDEETVSGLSATEQQETLADTALPVSEEAAQTPAKPDEEEKARS